MLTVPAPTEVENYKGVPLVHLPDDEADVSSFLTFIYDSTFEPIEQYSRDYAIKMRGALKLATKYGGDQIQAHILRRLRIAWPGNLEDWHRRWQNIDRGTVQKRNMAVLEDAGFHFNEEDLIWQTDQDVGAYEVIAMLRDSPLQGELRDVLAAAYYDLASNPGKMWRVRSGCLVELDFLRLLYGRNQLIVELSDHLRYEQEPGGIDKYYKGDYPGCADATCTEARRNFWSQFWELYPTRTDYLAFLAIMQDKATGSTWRFETGRFRLKICDACGHNIKEVLEEAREHIFTSLPKIFLRDSA